MDMECATVILLPAIDLRAGRCVRLRQGDYEQETVYQDDPVQVAVEWVRRGAQALHLVDLDGARAGHPINSVVIANICRSVPVPCQLGGGLRTRDHLAQAFQMGVARAILGTKAIQDANWLRLMIELYPDQLLLGVDAKDGLVATDGWLSQSAMPAIEFVKQWESTRLAGIVFTDISRDGMLNGPNWSALEAMIRTTCLPVYASGGITTVADVKRLLTLPVAGCIVGRALYEGQLRLEEALSAIVSRCVPASADASRS